MMSHNPNENVLLWRPLAQRSLVPARTLESQRESTSQCKQYHDRSTSAAFCAAASALSLSAFDASSEIRTNTKLRECETQNKLRPRQRALRWPSELQDSPLLLSIRCSAIVMCRRSNWQIIQTLLNSAAFVASAAASSADEL